MSLEDPLPGAMAKSADAGVRLEWATLYQPMNRIPYFASYSRTCRAKSVRM